MKGPGNHSDCEFPERESDNLRGRGAQYKRMNRGRPLTIAEAPAKPGRMRRGDKLRCIARELPREVSYARRTHGLRFAF
jgi:hypothetical protein